MRRKWIIALGFTLGSGIVFAQSRSDFKGPKAKNYKAWKHSLETTYVEIVNDRAELPKGPVAKNSKRSLGLFRRNMDEAGVSNENILNNERLGMIGPKAKNYKIGSN